MRQAAAAIVALAASLACQAADPPATPPSTPPADPPADTVLVKRGDITVTVGDFLANLEKLSPGDRYSFRTDVGRISTNVSAIFLARSVAEQARAEGMDKDPMMQRKLRLAQENVLAQAYMAKLEESIVYPDFEKQAAEIYKASPERYQKPARVKAKRIVATKQGRTDEEARRWAQAALDKLKAGENFGRVMREYSNDPSTRNTEGVVQGAYNLFDDNVAKVMRTAPIGELEGPIETGHSFEVIVVLDRLPAETLPFEQAKQAIIENEKAKFRKESIDRKLAEFTRSKDISIDTNAIASLQTEIDRTRLHEAHVEKARKDEEERKARLQQEQAAAAKAKAKGN